MMSLALVLAVAALTAISFSSPLTSKIQPSASFEIQQISNGVRVKDMQQELGRLEAKFGGAVPTGVMAATTATKSGEVVASPGPTEEAYVCPVTIGSQELMLDFDTGSADLWVFSTLLPANETKGHTLYNPNLSGKLVKGAKWSIEYGDASTAQGIVYNDTVTVGDIAVPLQEVEVAKQVSSEFVNEVYSDGLMGFSFPEDNEVQPHKALPWFFHALPSLAQPVMTIDLKHKQPGSYGFGFINESRYTGNITWTPSSGALGLWNLDIEGYSVGTKSTHTVFGAAVDTGTSIMLFPEAAVQDYYSQVKHASIQNGTVATNGGYIFPCKSILPDFIVQISSTNFSVPGALLNYGPASPGNKTYCYGGLQATFGFIPPLLGDTFLKAVFVVFDLSGGITSPRIGFATKEI